MDEVWERVVETALGGHSDDSSVRSLTLDGAVKCIHGRLPPSGLLERFRSLEHLSIANVGVSSLQKFPRLPNLQKLTLSDNRIAGGLEFLVEAGLASLRDLDLSNNRIQSVEDLAPLSRLKLVSLDLYECPVTRVKDYRSKVFSMIKSLKYLDKMDADENERFDSDEEDEEEDEDDEEEDDDPGSGEVDGEDRAGKAVSGVANQGVVDVDEDEESDADEEETETAQVTNGLHRTVAHSLSNGYCVATVGTSSDLGDDMEDDVEDDDEDDDLGEEIDEEEGDDDVAEVHEIDESEEDEDGVEEDEDEDEDDEEDVDDEEEDVGSTGRLESTEGEIDGHEHGEEDENGEIGEEDDLAEENGEYEDDDEENGEIGEEDDQRVEENGEYEEDEGEGEDEENIGSKYLVQPVRQANGAGHSSLYVGNEDEEGEEEVEDEEVKRLQPPLKRRRPNANNNISNGSNINDDAHVQLL